MGERLFNLMNKIAGFFGCELVPATKSRKMTYVDGFEDGFNLGATKKNDMPRLSENEDANLYLLKSAVRKTGGMTFDKRHG